MPPASAWVNGFQVSIGLLLLSVMASTSLAEERARGSMDLILTTPLSTGEIVIGKWLGAYRVVPLLAVLPALVIAAGAVRVDWLRRAGLSALDRLRVCRGRGDQRAWGWRWRR